MTSSPGLTLFLGASSFQPISFAKATGTAYIHNEVDAVLLYPKVLFLFGLDTKYLKYYIKINGKTIVRSIFTLTL